MRIAKCFAALVSSSDLDMMIAFIACAKKHDNKFSRNHIIDELVKDENYRLKPIPAITVDISKAANKFKRKGIIYVSSSTLEKVQGRRNSTTNKLVYSFNEEFI